MQRVLNTAKQRRHTRLLVLYWRYTRDNASVNSNSAHPPPGRPLGIRIFWKINWQMPYHRDKIVVQMPRGGGSNMSKMFYFLRFSSVCLVLLSVKSKLIQTKLSHSWVLFPVVGAKIGHSTALASHCMSYLDAFNKKLTVFADEFVIKKATML